MNATMTTTAKAIAATTANAWISSVVCGSEQVIGNEGFIQSTDCKHTQNEGNDFARKSGPPGDRVN